jgi:hypothetical protein
MMNKTKKKKKKKKKKKNERFYPIQVSILGPLAVW